MKTLQQIIERNDYKKVSKQLCDQIEEIAGAIQSKMESLDLKIFNDLRIVERSANGYNQSYLTRSDSGVLNVCSNSTQGKNRSGFYYAGNFNCWITFATNEEALSFIKKTQFYIDSLDEHETKKCEEMQKHIIN